SHLGWHDLARVAAAARLRAPLRASAEKILLLRLPELALGEKITLARGATRNVLRALGAEATPLVVPPLFEDPRFQVEDAVSMIARQDAPGAVLRFMAESARFAGSQELRLVIAAHPAAPPDVALRMMQRMDAPHLVRLLSGRDLPPLIALAARRR